MVVRIWKSYRLSNVVIVGLTIFTFCEFLAGNVVEASHLPEFWDHVLLFMLVGSTLFYGNLKNDFFDQKVDTENRKEHNAYFHFPKKLNKALSFFALLSGVTSAAILSANSSYFFFVYWIVVHGLLWSYNLYLKKIMFAGNILIALITAFTVFIPYYYYSFYHPITVTTGWSEVLLDPAAGKVMRVFFIMAFIVNWAREIIKDILDQYGDQVEGYKTMIIRWGLSRTITFILFLHLFLTVGLAYIFFYCWAGVFLWSAILFGMSLLLTLLVFPLFITERFTYLRSAYKLIMLLALLALLF